MTTAAAALAERIHAGIRSGKLKPDAAYSVPALAALLGTNRAGLTSTVHREFGTVAAFCTQLGVAGLVKG